MHADTTASASAIPARPRCVLMTADSVGGVWDYSLQLSAGLATRGVAVTLATMGPPPSAAQRAAAAAVEGLSVVSRDLRLEWMDAPWSDVDCAGEWLLDLESEVGADVVHLNGYAHGCLSWSAPVIVVAHSCVCSWWQAVHGEPAPAAWNPYRTRVRAGLRSADAVVAPTRTMLAALSAHYGPLGGGVVIPNGRPASALPPAAKAPLVLAAGRLWDDAKNVRLLASAAPALTWPVCVAGETRAPDGASATDWHPAPPGNLHFLGHLSPADLQGWLARAAIYALPAKYEPFGLTVLEAALAGCALVLGDIPSLRETWDGAAKFVHPGDRDGLVAAIQSLAREEHRRSGMADRARRRAAELSADRMTSAYIELYASLRRTPVSLSVEGAPCAS